MKALLNLVLAFLITGRAVVARANDNEYSRQSLKGLNGVAVIVEDLNPEEESAGLTEASIQTDVKLKLRLAGIQVVDEALSHFLYVNVNVVTGSTDYWPYNIDVEFLQDVRLVRDVSIIVAAETWSVGMAGGISKANVHKIRDYIKDQVDKFINAYLSVNPK